MIVHLPAAATPDPLLLYDTEERVGDPTEAPLSPLGDGTWSADVTGLTGRWWPTTGYVVGATPYRIDLPYVDLPEDPTLVVSPESLATSAGMTLPLTGTQREIITEAILDAQSDVRAYLGRAILPTVYTESGRYDDGTGRWNLTPLDEPVIEVLTVTADLIHDAPSGTFTITYRAGLNAQLDPALSPIRRYIKAAALNSPGFTRLWRTATSAKGEVRSLTTEGQAISYAPATLGGGGPGQPGELPKLSSLDYWRFAGRRVFQARTEPRPPWPYHGISSHGSYW